MKNVLLVDKSSFISKLASSTCKSFFACRPKKFGKTLFLGFLREFFLGNKALFEGLAISEDPSVTWEKYPVIHFDMTDVTGRDIAQIEATMKAMVCPRQAIFSDTFSTFFIRFLTLLVRWKWRSLMRRRCRRVLFFFN